MAALINFVTVQIGWFAAVLGAANQMPWLGPLVFVGVLAIHLRLVRRPDLEVGLVIACGIIGLLFDSVLVAAGWVVYPAGYVSEFLAPYWIVTMWMLFGTTLNLSMRWLRGRLALAAVLGATAGPGSYWAGQELGGITFVEPVPALAALAVGWGAIMPFLTILAERLDGVGPAGLVEERIR